MSTVSLIIHQLNASLADERNGVITLVHFLFLKKNAASTYNVLAEEGRRIAAAMLPNTPTDAISGKSVV